MNGKFKGNGGRLLNCEFGESCCVLPKYVHRKVFKIFHIINVKILAY